MNWREIIKLVLQILSILLGLTAGFAASQMRGCGSCPYEPPPGPIPCPPWTPPPQPVPPPPGAADAINATAKFRTGNTGCTATVVGPRRSDGKWDVLIAAHCVSGVGTKGRLYFKDGREVSVTVRVIARGPDLCWMVTDESINLPYALLAKDLPQIGTRVWHQGYGVDRPGNRETGQVVSGESQSGQLSMKLSVSSGDSGSGIFREDTNELVSVVCCYGQGKTYGGSCVQAERLRGAADYLVVEED